MKKARQSEEEKKTEQLPVSGTTVHPSLHHPVARSWSEPSLHAKQLMYPIFVRTEKEDKTVQGFEPNKQWGCENDFQSLVDHLTHLHVQLGLSSVMLFGVTSDKDEVGSKADCTESNPVILCLRRLAKSLPHLFLAADVCLCEYTSHGHCGVLLEHDHTLIHGPDTVKRLGELSFLNFLTDLTQNIKATLRWRMLSLVRTWCVIVI
jgi:porphobilinogen synthase